MWASGSRAIPNVPSFPDKGSLGVLAAIRGPALAASAGALAWAAFPPAGSFGPALGLVALTPLFLATRDATAARSFGLGLVAGSVMCGLGFSFLPRAAAAHGDVSPLLVGVGYAALTLYHGLFAAIPLALAAAFRARLPPCLGAPILLALAEITLPAPLPWSFGATLLDVGFVAPGAAVFGAPALSLLTFSTSAALAEVLAARAAHALARRAVTLALAVAASLAAASMTWSSLISEDLEGARALRVGALHTPAAAASGSRRPSDLSARAANLTRQGAAIVVAPETALPDTWPAASLEEALSPALDRTGATIATGAVVRDGDRAFNSALAIDADARVVGRYDKQSLLLLAETGAFSPGEDRPAFSLAGASVGVSICLEDTLPGSFRPGARRAPDLLVNLTNDSWFAGSLEPEAHFALARLRAIESGRYLVRSTAGGVTAAIDPLGRPQGRRGPDEQADLLADVSLLTRDAPRSRWGLVPFFFLCAAALGAASLVSRASSAPS